MPSSHLILYHLLLLLLSIFPSIKVFSSEQCHSPWYIVSCLYDDMKLLCHFRLFVIQWTAAYQAPPSVEFSKQEYSSGLPLPSPTFVWLILKDRSQKLDSRVKSRDITLPNKVHIVKAMVFPVVSCGCKSWTIKKTEHGIDAFELWFFKRLLRVPWTARRSN